MTAEQIEECYAVRFFSEIPRMTCAKTIILNAKTLIERDGDFAKFAARILLSYIYEEVLGWDIAENSIEELKAFHLGLKQYLKKASKLRD